MTLSDDLAAAKARMREGSGADDGDFRVVANPDTLSGVTRVAGMEVLRNRYVPPGEVYIINTGFFNDPVWSPWEFSDTVVEVGPAPGEPIPVWKIISLGN